MGKGMMMICKTYGGMKIKDRNGKEEVWLWDYAQDKPRRESEMKAEQKAASEKKKQMKAKAEIEKLNQQKLEL